MNTIYLIEGFDMVGKDTFVETTLPDYDFYHCSHDLTDGPFGRHNSWVIGYSVIDFLDQLSIDKESKNGRGVVINRGVFSSYVYSRLYQNRDLDRDVIEWYKNNRFFKEDVGHIYVKHQNSETARVIYDKSQSRDISPNIVTRAMDKFNTFSDYWVFYTNADLLFKEAYKEIGVVPKVLESVPDFTWNKVEF